MSEALSVDEAVNTLAPTEEAPLEAAQVQEIEGETSSPEEPEAEAETLADGDAEGDGTPEAETLLAPPLYWSPDAKAKFAALPPDLQAVVLEQEGPREAAAAKAKEEAKQARESAQKEVQGVRQLAEQLSTFLPQAIETFKSKWGDVDAPGYWKAIRETYGEEAERDYRDQYEAEQKQLAKLDQTRRIAESEAHKVFLREEAEKLFELAPDLMDPEKGTERRVEVGNYIVSQGIPADVLPTISAVEMSIARKAMLWDRAQAAVKAKPKQPAAPAKALVQPGPAVTQSSQNRTATQIANRFAQTRDVDDAVALLLARKG